MSEKMEIMSLAAFSDRKKTYVVQFKQASRKAFCKHCFMLFGATILGLTLSWSHDLPNKVVT